MLKLNSYGGKESLIPSSNIDLDNLSDEGLAKLGGQPIGLIYPLVCSEDYVPDGSLSTDGAEYSKSQFNSLWDNYLTSTEYQGFLSEKITLQDDLTINNGIVSSPSSGHIRFDNTSNSSVVFKYIANDLTSSQQIVDIGNTGVFGIQDGQFVGGFVDQPLQIENNTFYIKLTPKNAGVLIEVSYNDKDWITIVDYSNSFISNSFYQIVILNESLQGHGYYTGSVDLLNSYVLTGAYAEYFYTLKGNSLLNTCTYKEYENELNAYGFCNKFGIDLDNEKFRVPFAKQIDRYLIKKKEPTEDDLTWYNLYSDGYCEQGGYSDAKTATTTITLLLPYKDKNYTPDVTWKYTSTLGTYSPLVNVTSEKSFTVYHSNDGALKCSQYWKAKGYVDISAYELPRQFVVVANGQINQSMMDWSAWASSLQGKANVDGSNFIDSVKNFDGQWVQKFNVVARTGGTVAGVQYDLSEYLPTDNYTYEVKFKLGGYDDDSSYYYQIETDVFDTGNTATGNTDYKQIHGGVHARQTSIVFDLPVGNGRFVKLYGSGADNVELFTLGYRRIGINK